MTSRELFLQALRGGAGSRPPVWLMRQAGRYLPEYRALKARHSFLEMVRTPELAAEVTLQPLRRYAFDAAIIFSDILVVPEAMGMAYSFREEGGIRTAFTVTTRADLAKLAVAGAAGKLDYVARALRLTRGELREEKALLGFCGAPWTLAAYMTAGGSFASLPELTNMDERLFADLLDAITAVCLDYVRLQIAAGADAIQIFDSHAALCPPAVYRGVPSRCVKQIIAAAGATPVILFAPGADERDLATTGAACLGFDQTTDLAAARDRLPATVAVQGNLDPAVLLAGPAATRQAVGELLGAMRGKRGYIFNVGRGVLPATPPESVAALVEAVTGEGR